MLEGGPKLDLVVDNVSFAYASRSILENISFPYPGRGLCGDHRPQRVGQVDPAEEYEPGPGPQWGLPSIWAGRTWRRCLGSQLARKVAVVPQETMVNFAFTVEEVVLMGRTPHLGRFQWEGPERSASRQEGHGSNGDPAFGRPAHHYFERRGAAAGHHRPGPGPTAAGPPLG